MHEDVFVYYVQLPGKINETVTTCYGGYTVLIDPRQSTDGIRRSYLHALQHINNHDFERENVQDIETNAHMEV